MHLMNYIAVVSLQIGGSQENQGDIIQRAM